MRLIRTFRRGRALAVAGTALAVLAVMIATTAPANAAPDPTRVRRDTVAIALGTLVTPSGGHTYLSLQAGSAGDLTRGGFRYYCDEAGYYNGAVQSLTVADGAIHATGAGGLIRPDGTRMRVTFVLDVAADGSAVSVSITGAEYQYDMAGNLDGFVFAGSPADWGIH